MLAHALPFKTQRDAQLRCGPFNEQSLTGQTGKQPDMRALDLDTVLAAIRQLKTELIAKGEATELFGQLRGDGLTSAIATIEQGFGDELFYPNVASRSFFTRFSKFSASILLSSTKLLRASRMSLTLQIGSEHE